ncbi:MAG: secretin N-terminal domain-containing protein [Thermodesulfobacteriota bacterium]
MSVRQRKHNHSVKYTINVVLVLLFGLLLLPCVCPAEVAVIPVKYSKSAELLPLVKGLLSPRGSATFNERTHSLVVVDEPENINAVRSFLSRHDVPGKQVKIRVRFDSDRLTGRQAASGSASSRDGVRISYGQSSVREQGDSEYFILATSGSPAYIRTATDIPYKERWLTLGQRHAEISETLVFQRVETGMEVTPIVRGGYADITITPRISYLDDRGGQTVVRCTEASTSVSVPLGQWTTIGGTGSSESEEMKAILGGSRENRKASTSISLMVE